MADTPLVGIRALVVDDAGLVLMIRQPGSPDRYELPAGVPVVGETIASAASRAAHDATGVDVEITGVVGIYSSPEASELSICFRARPIGGSLRSGGSRPAEWIEPEIVDRLDMSSANRRCIQHGLADRVDPYFT